MQDDTKPQPRGELTLQVVAMPSDTNQNGDIFGGWLLSQMDIAAGVAATERAAGRCATVAVEAMNFLVPLKVGSLVSCYCDIVDTGQSSIRVFVEVWARLSNTGETIKVTDGEFVFVAIDQEGRTRLLPKKS